MSKPVGPVLRMSDDVDAIVAAIVDDNPGREVTVVGALMAFLAVLLSLTWSGLCRPTSRRRVRCRASPARRSPSSTGAHIPGSAGTASCG